MLTLSFWSSKFPIYSKSIIRFCIHLIRYKVPSTVFPEEFFRYSEIHIHEWMISNPWMLNQQLLLNFATRKPLSSVAFLSNWFSQHIVDYYFSLIALASSHERNNKERSENILRFCVCAVSQTAFDIGFILFLSLNFRWKVKLTLAVLKEIRYTQEDTGWWI